MFVSLQVAVVKLATLEVPRGTQVENSLYCENMRLSTKRAHFGVSVQRLLNCWNWYRFRMLLQRAYPFCL